MNNLRPTDFIAASLPTVSATVVAQANEWAGLIGSLIGILYLLWRWRREYLAQKDR
jgi:hypothetical protein